jgi:hypothetical protein
MHPVRAVTAAALSKGVISPGWYAVLTGLAMLYVAYLLGTVSGEDDAAAPFVALGLGIVGVAVLERGVRRELRRRRGR